MFIKVTINSFLYGEYKQLINVDNIAMIKQKINNKEDDLDEREILFKDRSSSLAVKETLDELEVLCNAK